MKTIWVSRDNDSKYDYIWTAPPTFYENTGFGSFAEIDSNLIGETRFNNDFFGVAPGECRRFLVIPDDDWIPVDDERKPEVGQVVWMTDLIDGKPYTVARLYLGGFGNQTVAWKPRCEPEPYKPEVAND